MEYKDKYDSQEELIFSWYIQELKTHDLIYDYKYHEFSYLLSEKVTIPVSIIVKGKEKHKERHLFYDHIYTPDFTLYWTKKGLKYMTETSRYFKYFNDGYFELSLKNNDYISIIDVKGSFAGRNNTTAITFPLNQKWVYQQTGDIVQKIIPIKLFEETFFPDRYFMDNENKRPRKKKIGIKFIELKDMKLPLIKDFLWKRDCYLSESQSIKK